MTADNFVEFNIASKEFDDQETKRMREVLTRLPQKLLKGREVAELGCGYGRNYKLLKEIFRMARFWLFEQSQANLDVAMSKMGVPKDDCICKAIQEFNWDFCANWFDVIIDWWTISYLTTLDLTKILE